VDDYEEYLAMDSRWSPNDTAGTLTLCHEGCCYEHFLVVTGPGRGQMWLNGRAGDFGFSPMGVDFLGWYERWLDSTLAGGDGIWWPANPSEYKQWHESILASGYGVWRPSESQE